MEKQFALIATVIAFLSLSDRAVAAAKTTHVGPNLVADAGDKVCDPSTFNQYLPFSLNDDLSPEVEDIVTETYLFNILPLGGLWGPLVLLPDDHPDMNEGDVVLSYLLPYLGGWFTSAVVGTFAAGATFYVGGLGAIIGCLGIVPMCYNAPTASLNAWDRAYKCSGKKHGKKKNKKKSESGGSDSGGAQDNSGYSY